MKKREVLSEIRLNKLDKNELNKRAMNALKGGSSCNCMGAIRYWCKAVPVPSTPPED